LFGSLHEASSESDGEDESDEEQVSKRLRFQREESPEITERNMGYQSVLLGRLSQDSEEESIVDNVSDNEGSSNVVFDGHEEETDDNSFDELLSSHHSMEEGSICSSDVDLINNEFEVELSTPRRRRTHIENEKAHQKNLFLLLPQLHQQRVRLESLRLTAHAERSCGTCGILNPIRLWRCKECSMLKHSSPMLCDECIVKRHINTLHCMDILCQEESVFRKPACGEIIIFKLVIERCHSCKMLNPVGNMTDSLDETKYIHVFVASQNGIFQCTRPHSENTCSGCGTKLICGPVGFDCLPCEPVDQSGCTWFTSSLISFIRTLRSEGGISTNALARAIMEHWRSSSSFLVNSQQGSSGTSHVPNITSHWLEKKLAQILTNGLLLEHPSWIDGGECFTLDDKLSSVCAACHERCAQIHIDGFFKMRRMRRAKSYRDPKLRFFCKVGRETVNGFRQLDLENSEEVVDMCTDLAGNVTEFRVGGGRQQSRSVGYSQTGILTAVCPHQVPSAIIPMETKGEKFFLPHAMLDFLEGGSYPGEVDFYSYDVACRMKSYLQVRAPDLHAKVDPKLVLGYFHSKSHKCRKWNVGYSKLGSGYNDGEQGERLNSIMLRYTSFLRYMREEHMHEAMEDFLMCLTRQANEKIDVTLHTKLTSSIGHLFEWHSNFVRSCKELEDRLSPQGFHLTSDEIQQWVKAYTTPPEDNSPTVEMTGTKIEQAYVSARFEWLKLGTNHEEAMAALQEINHLGEPIEDCLLDKKKYLMRVIKAYE
jgi:hypothetical protein